MKVATILPQAYMYLAEHQQYHMALAHMVGEEGYETYTEHYKKIGEDPDKYLIMDNGEFEGEQQTIEKILVKAYKIKANEIILPDAYKDSDETILRTISAYNYIKNNRYMLKKTYGYIPKLMIVPQGKDWEEVCDCLDVLLRLDIDTIGLPKHLALEDPMARFKVLKAFGMSLRSLDIHFLGCNEPLFVIQKIQQLIEIEHLSRSCQLRSIDSALPYVYARENKRINEDDRSHNPVDFKDLSTDFQLLKENVQYWEDIIEKGESKIV